MVASSVARRKDLSVAKVEIELTLALISLKFCYQTMLTDSWVWVGAVEWICIGAKKDLFEV